MHQAAIPPAAYRDDNGEAQSDSFCGQLANNSWRAIIEFLTFST